MKKNKTITGIVAFMAASLPSLAQEKNLVMNGSFENVHGRVNGTGTFTSVDSISSANNTTIDLYSRNSCGNDFDVPENYMGTQESKTGNNYAGFIAYYADDAGIFRTKPGYRKYSEYIQFAFAAPLEAGKAYALSYSISLAENSAYAVSGIGISFSSEKRDVQNNAFMNVAPNIMCADVLTSTEWTTISGVYIASGGERYLTLGCFDSYMETRKVVAPNTNNNRKAYYYLDDVSLTPQPISKEDIAYILSGTCYQLNNLNFETDKSVILAESYPELKSLSNFLKTYPHITVYIDGHTDITGTDEHNDKLSEERAKSVKTYLVTDGIDITRLKARGYGESLPIDNQNDDSFANRRVEITICSVSKN
ncbi:MAG: OmpA family protein [Flavobacteriales bacterium]